jgi:hypothetical protein
LPEPQICAFCVWPNCDQPETSSSYSESPALSSKLKLCKIEECRYSCSHVRNHAERRRLWSVRPSVRKTGKTRAFLDGFSWNLIYENCTKNYSKVVTLI